MLLGPLSLLIQLMAKEKIPKNQFFVKSQEINTLCEGSAKQVSLNSTCNTIVFHPQTQKLELHSK